MNKHISQGGLYLKRVLAPATAASTIGVSLGEVLNLIPDSIGKLGALFGVMLSAVLIVVHIRRSFLDGKLAKAQLRKLEREERSEQKGDI